MGGGTWGCSGKSGACLQNQPVTPGKRGEEREKMRERVRQPGLKTVKFKFKGPDKLQVFLPISSPSTFFTPNHLFFSWAGCRVMLWGRREGSPVGLGRKRKLKNQPGLKFLLSCLLVSPAWPLGLRASDHQSWRLVEL